MRRFLFAAAALLFSIPCFAQYDVATLDYPGAATTRLIGVNDRMEIVGHYIMAGGVRHAMMYSNGTFLALDADGVLGNNPSAATQINNRGDVSGWYSDAPGVRHGFVMRDGVVTTIDYPGSSFTQVNGVSDTGVVLGHFRDGNGVFHGFLIRDAVLSQLDYPGARDTLPFYMNGRGDIAGEWDSDPTVVGHGFLLTNAGQWVSFDAPGAPPNSTLAIGINDRREVLGCYRQANGQYRTFIVDADDLSPEGFRFVDLPGRGATPETLNNRGAFVGYYSDATGTHGLVAVPERGK